MARTLSTAEAARVLGMDESRVRQLVRLGLGRPGREGRRYALSFQDLVILRTAHGLMEERVPLARVARTLAKLAEALPPDRPLSGLRVSADGRGVAVHDETGAWNVETGQGLLDFEVDEISRRAEREVARSATPSEDPGDDPAARAQREFERALALEDDDPVEACSAYGRALDLDPGLVDAYVNLGCLAHRAGRAKEAIRCYGMALERTPDDPIVHFDLALALEETGALEHARHHHARAVALDPEFADAHYNLGGLCEKLGRPQEALRHYAEYRRLTR